MIARFYSAFSEKQLLRDKCIISLRLNVSLSTAWNQVSNQRQLSNWQSLLSNEINTGMHSHGTIFMCDECSGTYRTATTCGYSDECSGTPYVYNGIMIVR